MLKISKSFQYLLVAFLLAMIAAGKFVVATFFGDKDFEPDSYMHFLQAKTIFVNFPQNIGVGLDVWAKPLYALTHGAWLLLFNEPSLIHAKVLNIILFGAAGFLVYLIARKLGLKFEWALFTALASNLGFITLRSSLSVLTEPLFTVIFLAAILFYIRGSRVISAILIGLSVLCRFEALLFVGIWGLFELWKIYQQRQLKPKNIVVILLLLLPTIIWNIVGYLQSGRPAYLFTNGYPTTAGIYGFGHPLFYVEGLVVQEGMLMALLIASAVIALNRFRAKSLLTPYGFLAINAITFLVVQSVLYTFGMFGTAGILRYFILIIPVFWLLAAPVLQTLSEKVDLKPKLELLLILVFLGCYALGSLSILRSGGGYKGLENKPSVSTEFKNIWNEPALQAINKNTGNHVITNRPEIIYYSGRDLTKAKITTNFAAVPSNSLVIVEEDWARADNFKLAYFETQQGFSKLTLQGNYPKLSVYYRK